MADNIAMAVARKDGQPIACALYFHGGNTLYCRYWGCAAEYDYLHFELCYYQGIEYAIEQGLQRFDAGARGEHKIVRGFEPVPTHCTGFATPVLPRPLLSFSNGKRWKSNAILSRQKLDCLISRIVNPLDEGIGKPEPLKHDLASYWSRRINDEHRIVYKIQNDTTLIASQ